MKKETFEKACFINQRINESKNLQSRVKKMGKRENDDEYNELIEIAYNALSFKIGAYESDFNNL
ncbi:MAG: hypothetical protein V7767_11510 [Leeuwenhoekiella sp.]